MTPTTDAERSPIALPTEISSDGRELWDWAARFSDYTHRIDSMRTMRRDIAAIGTVCGDCDKWMKSSQCPKERNVNGRNHGPSIGTIRCGQFVEKLSSTSRRKELTAQLESLNQEPRT